MGEDFHQVLPEAMQFLFRACLDDRGINQSEASLVLGMFGICHY